MGSTVAIVGLGLIGGSFAKTLSQNSDYHIIGIDSNADILKAALKDKSIHEAGDISSLSKADITLVAIYPKACVDFVKQHRSLFKKGSIVSDLCGIKEFICSELVPVAINSGFIFIGAHPMAGKEVSGYENSCASLFAGASFIITPQDAPAGAVDKLSQLAQKAGFAKIVTTTPQVHDDIIAFTSQLPHALACAYVQDPASLKHSGFSAGSFKDVSRVALINEILWSELFIQNSENLTRHIDIIISNLTAIKDAVKHGDRFKLEKLLRDSRAIMEELDL